MVDLHRDYEELRPELDTAYHRVMASGRYLFGSELTAFESEYASAVGTREVVGVANGLEALQLALLALGVGAGDEVVVPSNGYIATWLAVSHAGAKVVPCEPNPQTHNLDPKRLVEVVSARTKVIMPIHLYGQTAEMDPIMEFAQARGLAVLEDAAQAHGATYRGRAAGTLGHAAAFSFYPTKNLGALADAGAVATDDPALAERVRCLRNYGSTIRYQHEIVGFNSRLGELQAAFLRAKLGHLADWNARRTAVAARYLAELKGIDGLILPDVPEWSHPVWHLFVVRTSRRSALRAHLESLHISTDVHYPTPPHLSGAYRPLGFKRGDFPIAEALADEVLSLPIGPHLTAEQAEDICDGVRSFFQSA